MPEMWLNRPPVPKEHKIRVRKLFGKQGFRWVLSIPTARPNRYSVHEFTTWEEAYSSAFALRDWIQKNERA